MASSSSLLLQINDDYLTCQICMELYQSPKVLTCLHSFCKSCLDSCEKSEHGSFIQCPLCRQSTTLGMKGVEGLKNNFVLSNMISMMVEWRKVHARDDVVNDAPMCQTCPANESVMATFQCIECLDQLCADCAAFHSRTKLTRDHEIVSLDDVENGKYKEKIRQQEMNRCKKHKHLKTEHYCRDCERIICKECIIEDHHGHPLSPLEETLDQVRSELVSSQENMKQKLELSQQALNNLIEIEDNHKSEFETVERELNNYEEEIIRAIKQNKTELLEYMEKTQSEKLSAIVFVKDHLDSQIKCMKNCTQLTECLLQTGTANEMLRLKKNMKETMKELQTTTEKTAENCLSDKICEKLGFIPNVEIPIDLKLGTIQNKGDSTIASFIQNEIFKQPDHDKTSQSPNKKVPLKRSNPPTGSKPLCSNEKIKSELGEILYVNLPQESKKPMPTPRARPRKSKSTLDLSSTKHLSLYVDDTDKAKEYDQFSDPQSSKHDDSLNDKPRNVFPVKPQKRSNHYPTAPRRKPHSVAMPIQDYDFDRSDSNSQSSSYRVAPAPPLALKPSKNSPINKQAGKIKYHSPKKAQAPLPPTVSPNAGILKAEVLKVFEISKQGSKDFYASLQGVAMTRNYIAVLDSDGQQTILFNTEGFYKTRFQVHIPNQDKIKPTGITISASENIYILYPNVVTVWTSEGMLLSVFGHQHLVDAHGIAVDSQERIVVVDEGKQHIVIFNKYGNFVTNFNLKQALMQCPRYICTTSRDEIVISDYQSSVVNIFDSSGKLLTACDSKTERKLKLPRGVAAIWPKKGQSEVLLIADQGHNRVSAYNLQGKFLYHVLELSNDSGLKNPAYIAVLDNKKLVVLQNNSIKSRLYNLKHTMPS